MDVSFLDQLVPSQMSDSNDGGGMVVLLTGATGFLGRFLLWELLHNDQCTMVYCISRDWNGVCTYGYMCIKHSCVHVHAHHNPFCPGGAPHFCVYVVCAAID